MSVSRAAVFVDTHAFLALLNSDEEHHDRVVEWFELFDSQRLSVFSSDWVFAEFLSFCAERPLRKPATLLIEHLRRSGAMNIVGASRKTFDDALRLYRSRMDKNWSLIDCTSIVICSQRSIGRVLTHDHHFVQAGLEILVP